MAKVDKLEWLIQTAIPSVFDDSLSFYELVSKVLAKLDEIIDQSNEFFGADIEQYVTDILEQYVVDGTMDELITKATLTGIDRMYLQNEGGTSTEYQFELANFGGPQDIDRRAFVIHHYNDGEMIVLDNVGDNVFMLMRNANNPVRRGDKPANYSGQGDFIRMQNMYDNAGTLQAVNVLEVKKNGDLVWGHQGASVNQGVKLQNLQASNNGKFAFTLANQYYNTNVLDIQSEVGKTVFWVQNPLGTRADLVTSNAMTGGMKVTSSKGNMELSAPEGLIQLTAPAFSKTSTGWAQLARFVPKPASATAAGERGDYFADTSFIYVCIGTNQWVRSAASTW